MFPSFMQQEEHEKRANNKRASAECNNEAMFQNIDGSTMTSGKKALVFKSIIEEEVLGSQKGSILAMPVDFDGTQQISN